MPIRLLVSHMHDHQNQSFLVNKLNTIFCDTKFEPNLSKLKLDVTCPSMTLADLVLHVCFILLSHDPTSRFIFTIFEFNPSKLKFDLTLTLTNIIVFILYPYLAHYFQVYFHLV